MESNTGKTSQKELEKFNYLLGTDNEIELWGHKVKRKLYLKKDYC